MADMDVTAKFRADISDMKSKMDTISRDLGQMNTRAQGAGKGFTVMRGAIATAFGNAVIGGIAAGARAMGDFVTGAISAADESVKTVARLDAIATSIGVMDTVLGGSTQRLLDQAQAFQDQTGISDEVVKGAQAMILTFKSVAETAGETGGVFDRTTQAALDLSAAGFGDVNGQAKALARALEDPVRGLSMLGRSGVTFTDQQKEMINALVEGGQQLEAQNIILEGVEAQVGGTAAAMATDADKLKATFADLKEGIGLALFPVLQELASALMPIVKDLQEPLSQIAEVIGGALSQAFQALAPLIGPLATALASIGQAITTALAGALQSLIPALVPVAENLTNLATQIAPILSKVLGKLGEIFGRVLGAVTPLLGPLTDLVMGILDAAWPIVEVVADALLLLVDALAPVLQAVMTLIKPLGDLIQVALAAFLPILKPILPVIEALANILGTILTKAIGILLISIGALIQGWSKVAPFVLNNVAKPVLEHFFNMAEGVVGAAADMLGWVPGLGSALQDAEAAVKEFAAESQAAVGQAADTIAAEGTRIGQEMVTQGQAALADAGPALGNSAAQLGRYVAGQYNYAVASGMGKAFAAMEGDIPAPAAPAPPPSPTPAPSPSGTPSGSSSASSQEDKRLEQIRKFVEGFERALERVQRGQDTLVSSTQRAGAQFAGALEEMLPESEVQQMFGPTGTIGGVISQYDQLDAAITDLYTPLTNAKRFGKEAADTARGLMGQAKEFLKAATETALALMKAKARNVQALEDAERDYNTLVKDINDTYDALDKAAADNIKAIESRWNAAIPALEAALASTSEAYERENKILEDLQKDRQQFLGKVSEDFRKFVNDLGGEDGTLRSRLQDRLKDVREFAANIRTLVARGLDPTLVREFVSAGVSGAGAAAAELATASQADIQAINQVQSGLASEIAGFQDYASQQWFDAGIAQQEAIVAPLAAARDQAQAALDAANAARTAELAAAQAHAEALRVQRQQALDAAKDQYDAQKEALIQQGEDIDKALTENANNLHNGIAALQESVPPEMMEAGKKSVTEMLAGFQEEFPGMKKKLNAMMNRLAASMNRTATITVQTVYAAAPSVASAMIPGRARGGPVQARQAYIVGERGPELFVSSQAGNIIPNHQLGTVPNMSAGRGASGGQGTTINLTVNAGMGADGAEVGRHVVEALKRYERRNGPIPVTTR